jgi:hypothetical protein
MPQLPSTSSNLGVRLFCGLLEHSQNFRVIRDSDPGDYNDRTRIITIKFFQVQGRII